jgi:Cu2+-exporting ATPase
MVGIGKGAEDNILIKDAEALQLTRDLDVVVLDKTGTITEGKPSVECIEWLHGAENEEYRNILYSLESVSEHPLAEAVTAYLKPKASPVKLLNINAISGKGIRATFQHKTYFAGSSKWMEENHIKMDPGLNETTRQWKDQANTVICFAGQAEVLAILSVADKIKESSAAAIRELQHMGLEVVMLTGDNRQTAEAVARRTGLTRYSAEMLPQAMAGDGINDSHALATADVSIAMGKGSDIAIDAAKMTIIGNDLEKIPAAIRLSRNTVKTIRQNLFWAFIYNIIGIPIAAGVLFPVNGFLLNPMIAGAAMALSSVSVVSNSLRLKRSQNRR